MITAEQVRSATFQPTKFREGYDQNEVDSLLDRVVATLTALARGEFTGPLVLPEEVADASFRRTKIREGYDMAQVDDLFDQVRGTLEAYRDRSAAPLAQPARSAPADVARPGVDQPAPGDARFAPPSTPAPPSTARPSLTASDVVNRLQLARATRPSTSSDRIVVRTSDGRLHPVADIDSTADAIVIRLA